VSASDQITAIKTRPLALLMLGATEAESRRCLELISASGFSVASENSHHKDELEQSLETQRWDLLLQCHPLKEISTQQIIELLNHQNTDSALLMLSDELTSEEALQALRDGARDAVSLQHSEHLQLTIEREIEDLEDRRHLRRLRAEKSHAEQQATTPPVNKKDLLTGLYSQRYFISGSQQIFKKTPPDGHTHHAMLSIKLDHIDTIRGQVGIAAADLIIAEIANCIRNYIPNTYPIARFDDSSFTILLHKSALDKSLTVAGAVCQTVSDYQVDVAGTDIPAVTCSVGIATTSEKTCTVQLLIRKAQMACEGAIAAGGNQPHLYDPQNDEQYGLAKELQEAQKYELKIRQALKENRFKLLYQPIVSLKSNTAENYEILLRMLDENHEEILPGEFMPQAAQADLMPAIDRWVIRNALNELSGRRRDGKDTSFFIKLDHTTLSDNDFHTWLSERLRANKMPGDALVFEISERSDIRSPDEVSHFINQLKILRCRCGLDHFGDNEASLERMQRLPVDFIKIDRNLIQRISKEDKVKAMVKQLVTIAHSNKQLTIAEFVQDANTLSALWSCDMDCIQGYFLQRPDGTMDYDFTEEN